jgi:hypothetical protein
MSSSDVINMIFEDGFKGAAMCLLLVLAYKIYRMRISNEIESSCCPGFSWRLSSSNSGGELDMVGRRSSNPVEREEV